jgi:hypothetical protein
LRITQDAALPHQYRANAIGGGHPEDHLDRLAVVIAPVAAQHQRASRRRIRSVKNGVEHRLNEIFEITGRLENRDLLAQTRGAGLLVIEGGRGDGSDVHRASLLNEVDAE